MEKQYKEPEEMIDHNSNLDTVSGLMSIFFAYNQKQVDQGTIWTKWPDWELCLTSMKDDLHFEDEKDSDEIRARRSHWLALFHRYCYHHGSLTNNTSLEDLLAHLNPQ